MSQKCHNPTWRQSSFSCGLLGDFAGLLNEKLRDRAERTVPQGDDAEWDAAIDSLIGKTLIPGAAWEISV